MCRKDSLQETGTKSEALEQTQRRSTAIERSTRGTKVTRLWQRPDCPICPNDEDRHRPQLQLLKNVGEAACISRCQGWLVVDVASLCRAVYFAVFGEQLRSISLPHTVTKLLLRSQNVRFASSSTATGTIEVYLNSIPRNLIQPSVPGHFELKSRRRVRNVALRWHNRVVHASVWFSSFHRGGTCQLSSGGRITPYKLPIWT